MLSKLIAEIHGNSSKLWVRILLEKYGQHGDCLFLEPPPLSSSTWKAICHANRLLGDGFKLRLSNGSSSFWNVNWLNECLLNQLVPYVHILDSSLRVCDVWTNNS